MSTSERPISEYLEVTRRFRRSVNLDKDFRGAQQNGEYIVTPTALEALHRLSEGFVEGSPSRAWTITGPYGVGKSAYAVFLARLLCSLEDSARQQVKQLAPELAVQLDDRGICQNGSHGFLPVLVTARRAPAAQCLAESIIAALRGEDNKRLKAVGRKLQADLKENASDMPLDSRWVVAALEMAANAAREVGHDGVLLIIDELGKFFEYAARYPQHGDVYVLQELAEHVARSQDAPTILVGLLHQSFEEYGHHLDQGTRREWSKIQGRFGDIAFLEPADQVARMVAQAIKVTDSKRPRGFKKELDRVVSAAAQGGVSPPGMSMDEFKRVATAAYPLHPLTLVALPYIFRRFAQNERSLFSYLSSLEPYGFQDFIRQRPMCGKSLEFVRLHDLFDYFTSNFGLGLYRQPQALRWLEAADVLESKDDLSIPHQNVVKTVGVLNALGQFSHLSATSEMISLALYDATSPNDRLQEVMGDLREASVLTYRSYNRSYRIWEGSDVDIEERIAEGERQTQQSFELADNVRQCVPSRPMVARRHSFETGALRFFDVIHVDSDEAIEELIQAAPEINGRVVVCLAESTALAEKMRMRAELYSTATNVLFAIPQQIGELRGIVTELGAMRWVWQNTPELRDDRVARRELSLRITEAELLLQRNLHGLVDPRPEPIGSSCLWYHAGQPQDVFSPADVSQLLSRVYDRFYNSSPKIRNELVVRRNVSAAAAAARRNLIEAMLNRSDQPCLGIEGYPPERSIYESVLHATGVHKQLKDGSWGFMTPSRSSKHNLLPSWKHLTDLVFKRQPEPLPVDELFGELAAPPYGVLDGLHPVILCAFMMVYPDETTLYREGTFLPEPGVADFEVLMRRPELFAVAGSRVKGGRAAVVERLAKGMEVKPAAVPVVRSLFRMVKSLPEFAWNTRELSQETLALRDAFRNAQSPEQFLFVHVPTAFGFEPFSERKPKSQEIEEFFTALNGSLQQWAAVSPNALDNARDALLNACGLGAGERGWESLRHQAISLEHSVSDSQLLTFVRRVAQSNLGREGVESVCALVASRPHANWTDKDVERFPEVAAALGSKFRHASASSKDVSSSTESLRDLNSSERKRADKLLQGLRAHLRKNAGAESSRVIAAVLAELAREASKQTGE